MKEPVIVKVPFAERVAKVCHEANRAYCETMGDFSQKSWEEAPSWQKESAMEGVNFRLQNPGAPASAMHEKWVAHKQKDGWKYGPIKDVEKKEHPCMVLYSELDPAQRTKDHIFSSIVDAMRKQE